MNNILLPRVAAEKTEEADYDISDFDYDEDPQKKKKREDKLDSPDEEVPVEEWEEEDTEDTTDYDSGDSEY